MSQAIVGYVTLRQRDPGSCFFYQMTVNFFKTLNTSTMDHGFYEADINLSLGLLLDYSVFTKP